MATHPSTLQLGMCQTVRKRAGIAKTLFLAMSLLSVYL